MSESAIGTARLVKDRLPNFTGHANLYRLNPPMECENGTFEYVVVSATMVYPLGPETYIFAADSKGQVTDWGELPGSFRGALDHRAALAGAGYVVVVNR